jgi:TPR repeat protein
MLMLALPIALDARHAGACGWWGDSADEDDDAIVVGPDGERLGSAADGQAASTPGANGSEEQAALGDRYRTGTGVSRDLDQAADWYRKAAKGGHSGAMNNLGVLHERGLGVPRSDVSAAYWFRKAADLGDPRAQHSLAEMYLEGRGVPKDSSAGAIWMQKAAERGHVAAISELAALNWHGKGVSGDAVRACMWWLIAARYGDESGLNRCRRSGGGVDPSSLEEALRLASAWKPRAAPGSPGQPRAAPGSQ